MQFVRDSTATHRQALRLAPGLGAVSTASWLIYSLDLIIINEHTLLLTTIMAEIYHIRTSSGQTLAPEIMVMIWKDEYKPCHGAALCYSPNLIYLYILDIQF